MGVILSFTLENFRSFADEATLVMARSSLRTRVPRVGEQWADHVLPAIALVGANASGKSTILEAIRALATAMRRPGAGTVFQPHRASSGEDSCATRFEVEFTSGRERYRYAVEACAWGIRRETLHAQQAGAPRLLFDRHGEDSGARQELRKGPSLTGPTNEVWKITKPSMLFLGVALQYGHQMLAPLAEQVALDAGVSFVSFRDRLDWSLMQRVVLEMMAYPNQQVDLVKALLQAADLGIEEIDVQERELPDEVRERAARLINALHEGESTDEVDVPRIMEEIRFRHRGPEGRVFELRLDQESAGTLTWITIAWHALRALHEGSVLLVDEIDASLHPELVRFVVSLFQHPSTNPAGAQVIFTTHDVSLLGNAPVKLLEPAQVWLTEKGYDGRSDLYSMADFDHRGGNNNERRYLAGKFGAVPDVDESMILRFVSQGTVKTAS